MKKMYTIFILLLGVFNLSCSESKTGTYSENKTEKNIFNTIVDTISGAKFEYNVAESTPDTFNLVHLFLPESYDAQLLNDKHPENIRNYEAADIFDLLFEGLVRIDENGKIVPGLAEKWETGKDKTKWTFHLRKGLKYSDGTPIKAEDFKTALLRMLNPEIISPNTDVLFLIKNGREFYEGKVKAENVGIKILDNNETIELELTKPIGYFDMLMTKVEFSPLNQEFFGKLGEKYGKIPENILYSGPYIIKSIGKRKLLLEKNKNYWNGNSIKMNKINIYGGLWDGNDYKRIAESKGIDATVVYSQFFSRTKLKNDMKETQRLSAGSYYYYVFNTKVKALSNPKVRKAIDAVMAGETRREYEFVPGYISINGKNFSALAAKNGKAESGSYHYKNIKELLDEGLKELGISKMPVLNIAIKENSIDGFSENLKKHLGIDVEVTRMSYKDLILKSRKKDFDIIENEILLGFSDPILYLERFVSDSPYNYGSYSNSEYDKLIKIASETKDINVKTDVLVKAENIYEKENPAAKMGYGEITRVILKRQGIIELKLVPYGGILYLRNVNKAK